MKNRSRNTKKTRKYRKRVLGGTDEEVPPQQNNDNAQPAPSLGVRDYVRTGFADYVIPAARNTGNFLAPTFKNVFGTYDYLANKVKLGVEQGNWSANENQFCVAFANLYEKIQAKLDRIYPLYAPNGSDIHDEYRKHHLIHSHFGIYDEVGNSKNEQPSNYKDLQFTRLCNSIERNRGMREVVQKWKDTYNNAEKPDTLFKKAQGYLNNAEKTKNNERFIKIMGDNNEKITVWLDDIYTNDVLLDLANLDSLLTKRSQESASKDNSNMSDKNIVCYANFKFIDNFISIIDRHPNKKDLLNFFHLLKDTYFDENGKLDREKGHLKNSDYYKTGCTDLEREYLTGIFEYITEAISTAPVENKGPNLGRRYIIKTGITGTGFLGNRLYLKDVFPVDEFDRMTDELNSGFVDVGFGGRKRNKTRKNKKRSVTRKHK
jgi:hypothetical protein